MDHFWTVLANSGHFGLLWATLSQLAEIDISVSRLLPIFLGFLFPRIWSWKKGIGFRKFSLEKSLGLGKLGLEKKYCFGSREFGLG